MGTSAQELEASSCQTGGLQNNSEHRDFYVLVRELISRLEEGREHDWAAALRDAMAISSVGSEVIGEIGAVLRDLATTTILKRFRIEADVHACRERVRTVWPDL